MQLTGRIPVLSDLQRLSSIWAAMGWHTRVIHGHDFEEIQDALTWSTLLHDKPKIIFADTVKGKGIRFMENDPAFHCSCLTRAELQAAKQELLS